MWSWLWGPVGLVLSTPLTVCLAVLGKHVPRLSYLSVVLGDEPALGDDLVLYQRLLSGDDEEAQEILDKRFRAVPRGQVFDEVVIPTLILAGRDRARNEISEAEHQNVLRTIRTLVEAVPDDSAASRPEVTATAGETVSESRRGAPQRVLGVSARTVTDEAIWEMLAQLFDPASVQVESVGSAYLASGVTPVAEEQPPDVVCVISIPPAGSPRPATSAGVCARSCPTRPFW